MEAVITLLPIPVLPFFILLFIIGVFNKNFYLFIYTDTNQANVAVCAFPIEILPRIYRYGYAMPFYNVSRGIRTVLFATKNAGLLAFFPLNRTNADPDICSALYIWHTYRMDSTLLYHHSIVPVVCPAS